MQVALLWRSPTLRAEAYRLSLALPPTTQRYMHLDDRELAEAQDLVE